MEEPNQEELSRINTEPKNLKVRFEHTFRGFDSLREYLENSGFNAANK